MKRAASYLLSFGVLAWVSPVLAEDISKSTRSVASAQNQAVPEIKDGKLWLVTKGQQAIWQVPEISENKPYGLPKVASSNPGEPAK